MSREFKVTVLIPCHSLEYLHQSIKSIEEQTLSADEFEILLVADRIDSREASLVLEKFKVNCRIIESQAPGIVEALNLGLRNITSKYVARMDEDDLMMPNRLEQQLNYLEYNENVLAVGGQIYFIDDQGVRIGRDFHRKKIELKDSHLLTASPIAHPAVMFRVASVAKVGGYRDFLPEDWDLWVRLREIGQIENLGSTILKYRIHPKQLSREKMYSKWMGSQYVATSYFARECKIADQPKVDQSPDSWLEETQRQLREISKKYVKFENQSAQFKEIEYIRELFQTRERIIREIQICLRHPILISGYFTSKLFKKIKILFLKFDKVYE
jgi:glycosyltransferase involved in cell wall biosynthesis